MSVTANTLVSARTNKFPDVPQFLESGSITYEKVALLGKGAKGICYEFKRDGSPKNVALKALTSLATAVNEIKIHHKLIHKNIVQFYRVCKLENILFICMESCTSDTLYSIQTRRFTITEPEARFFIGQTLRGIVYLHEKGIVHRDIKLSNIFLSEEMVPKIGDFGLARQTETKPCVVGTVNYISPEVVKHGKCTPKRDIWALGVCFYTLLHGVVPFIQTSRDKIIKNSTTENFKIDPNISSSAGDLLRKLLEPSYEDRISALDAIQDKFFTSGYTPTSLPTSCLTIEPVFCKSPPLIVGQQHNEKVRKQMRETISKLRIITNPLCREENFPSDISLDEKLNPEARPVFWVTDFKRDGTLIKYVFNDNSMGIMSKYERGGVLSPDGQKLTTISRDGNETFYNVEDVTDSNSDAKQLLDKLMVMHRSYENIPPVSKVYETDVCQFRRPYLRVVYLNENFAFIESATGVWQFIFHDKDPISLVICPQSQSISILDKDKKLTNTMTVRTYRIRGIPEALQQRVKTACSVIDRTFFLKASEEPEAKRPKLDAQPFPDSV